MLVHGAWADGSSWSEVIPRLQAAGLHVTAVQNPLTSIEDSVAEARRVLALQDGPTVLVAHSWSGTIISEIGTDPKVSALVYVAARAPDANEDFVALSGKFPTMPVRAGVQNNDGFTTISEDAFIKYFANGVQHEKAEVLYAVRKAHQGVVFLDEIGELGRDEQAMLLKAVEEKRFFPLSIASRSCWTHAPCFPCSCAMFFWHWPPTNSSARNGLRANVLMVEYQ